MSRSKKTALAREVAWHIRQFNEIDEFPEFNLRKSEVDAVISEIEEFLLENPHFKVSDLEVYHFCGCDTCSTLHYNADCIINQD